jgi:hypothetical protein
MQAAQETLQGTPTTLPTSEPGAGSEQVSYTVVSGDLPTFSGSVPIAQTWIADVIAAGKAVTAATISWRMKKNGSNVATGTQAVAANTFYTVNAYFVGVAVGDVLTISLWSNQTDSNWDYNAYQIHYDRLIPENPNKLYVYNLTYTLFTPNANLPTLVKGNPASTGTQYPNFNVGNSGFAVPISSSQNVGALLVSSIYGLVRMYYGEQAGVNTAIVNTSATYRPYYYQDYHWVSTIGWRYLDRALK